MPEEGTRAGAEPHYEEAGHGQGGNDSLPRGYPRVGGNRQVGVVLALWPIDRRG